jgi:nucleoside-diphosphate-sugar epimerase
MHAWRDRKIHVLGGGKQWRPNVHVLDVAKAFIAVIEADKARIAGEIFNVGSNEQNYQVLRIANIIRDIIPYVVVETVSDDADKRSYNVCFDKIAKTLDYHVDHTVPEGVVEIKDALDQGFLDYEDPRTITLKYYQYLLKAEATVNEVMLYGRVL